MENSFKKGEIFENYVENKIFSKESYDLIHRTNNYEQNKNRYAEETMRPDFKFRCKQTNREFYVEAKYRSKFNYNDMLNILTIEQNKRFHQIQKEECPIYILVGFEGVPSTPSSISLIPLDELIYLDLYRSVLRKYEVSKKPINNSILKLYPESSSNQEKSIEQRNIKTPKLHNSLSKKNVYSFLAIALILVFSLSFLWPNKNNQTEEQLVQNIESYYKTVELKNIDLLSYYVDNNVERWFDKKNVSIDFIKKSTKQYQKKYQFTEIKIDWESLKYSALPNKRYAVSYNIDYKVKKRKSDSYRKFRLKINTIWNKELKLISMYEEKI